MYEGETKTQHASTAFSSKHIFWQETISTTDFSLAISPIRTVFPILFRSLDGWSKM